jgi:hypothetical protein
VTADADLGSSTLLFSSEGATVVTDAATRRDARKTPAAAARQASPLDLPKTDGKRPDSELVN